VANDEALTRAAEVNEQFRPVQLSAETVTRPAGPQSRTVHSFLRHLRTKGLDCVPEPLSLSEETEVLWYIDGESGGDGWKNQHEERGLRSAAQLLRRIHDASADWVPPHDAVFDAPPAAAGGDVFVHGDPGPWNFVWRNGEAVALIDWDFLHPAPRIDDVAYALLWFAPMRDDESSLQWHHFPHVPDRRARIDAFLDAYGMLSDVDVADAVIERRHATIEHVRFLADQGMEPQRTWVAEGSLEREAAEIDWIEANRSLFVR
jgi:aminoglycoside phosphotransferase (APT) family kinase protein